MPGCGSFHVKREISFLPDGFTTRHLFPSSTTSEWHFQKWQLKKKKNLKGNFIFFFFFFFNILHIFVMLQGDC